MWGESARLSSAQTQSGPDGGGRGERGRPAAPAGDCPAAM